MLPESPPPPTVHKGFVGFGFGAIQAGLFLYEAHRSQNFSSLAVADVDKELIHALRANMGFYTVNIAHATHIESVVVGPIQIFDTTNPDEHPALVEAITQASEIATAVPSVKLYTAGGASSIASLLAQGLTPDTLVYTAENDTRAAEKLQAAVGAKAQFVNTVIGKMSRIVTDPEEMEVKKLTPICPGLDRAFLVESFNQIYISDTCNLPRGLQIFEEQPDLDPFEELKLYGHNAIHATAAYIGQALGCPDMATMPTIHNLMPFLRNILQYELGTALLKRYPHTGHPFTTDGIHAYVDDLLQRIVNPYLDDTMERVGRDPERKLGWNDRLIGALRMCQAEKVPAHGLGIGIALAVQNFAHDHTDSTTLLNELWAQDAPDTREQEQILAAIAQAAKQIEEGTLDDLIARITTK